MPQALGHQQQCMGDLQDTALVVLDSINFNRLGQNLWFTQKEQEQEQEVKNGQLFFCEKTKLFFSNLMIPQAKFGLFYTDYIQLWIFQSTPNL